MKRDLDRYMEEAGLDGHLIAPTKLAEIAAKPPK